MQEIRIDPVTKRKVIISTKRGDRPSDLKEDKKEEKNRKQIDGNCPFCPGNENKTPKEIYQIGRVKWDIRVVPNKYFALSPDEYKIKQDNFFKTYIGHGYHEVVIETNKHNETFYNMNKLKFRDIIDTYSKRYSELAQEKDVKYISLFKNHGKKSGASLIHSHSQIIALPFIPKDIYEELKEGREYYKENKKCVYCELIEQEIKQNKRIIHMDENFIVLAPFASAERYEVMILPLRHEMNFSNINKCEIETLSYIFKNVFSKYKNILGEISFNIFFDTFFEKGFNESYHWKIKIIPRFSSYAGFELATGIHINTLLPEKIAEKFKF